MSVFRNVTLSCPGCGGALPFQLVSSVNADRAPDLREAIVASRFQCETCSTCGSSFRVDPRFALIDHGRLRWIGALPLSQRNRFPSAEAEALASFERAYGAKASPTIRSIGATLRRRVTFGWAGLREKLLCDDLGLDDSVVELCKLAVLRSVDSAPVDRRTELRLLAADKRWLHFAWLLSAGERPIEPLRLERAAYDDIAADEGGDWAALRWELSSGPFVDIARLTIAAEA